MSETEPTTTIATTGYVRAEIVDYGNVSDVTETLAAGPNFDGGGGANIYAS